MTELVPGRLRERLARTPELSRAYLVGGCVRDALLGQSVKDIDIEEVPVEDIIRQLFQRDTQPASGAGP